MREQERKERGSKKEERETACRKNRGRRTKNQEIKDGERDPERKIEQRESESKREREERERGREGERVREKDSKREREKERERERPTDNKRD